MPGRELKDSCSLQAKAYLRVEKTQKEKTTARHIVEKRLFFTNDGFPELRADFLP